ncbi:hypothetical protein Psi02_06510 [Planotetraspora silvatica]|uniref:Uncharacterized protein n=1 Tax=Planotetraspora silvatica TaxID=234614 RepID=A0A8J3XJH6_9ACTN|nr:hypothetical protein [Planotetraspora silvatica]GII44227.1 hypothetical protein Psi02_06510 [Planotetraspora silvatica]
MGCIDATDATDATEAAEVTVDSAGTDGIDEIARTGGVAGMISRSPPGRAPRMRIDGVPGTGRVPNATCRGAPGRTNGRRARRCAAGRLRRSSGHDLLDGPGTRRSAGAEMAGAAFTPDKTESMTLSMNSC